MSPRNRIRSERSLAHVAVFSVAFCGALAGCRGESPGGGNGKTVTAGPVDETAEASVVDVWMDVDPAIGLPSGEVDDGLMMLQVFHSPELRARGVSVVFGNTSLEKGLAIARQVVDRFGPADLIVAAGAASAEELGEETDAVRAMAAALEDRPLVLLAVGPVTNVATLVQLHPELHERIESIVMVAARRVGQSFRTGDPSNVPHRDFNFELDPLAMQAILDTEIPLVFAPWEVSSHVWLRQSDLAALESRSPAGEWVAQSCASWVERWQENLGVDGFNPFDTLAAAWVSHPQLIEAMDVGVWIEDGEDDTQPGSGQSKPYLLVAPDLGEERGELRSVIYTYRPDPAFKELLLDRLAGR